jgi:hypothetical protein
MVDVGGIIVGSVQESVRVNHASLDGPAVVVVNDSIMVLVGSDINSTGQVIRRMKFKQGCIALLDSFTQCRVTVAQGGRTQSVAVASASQLTELISYFPNNGDMCVDEVSKFFVRVFGGDVADHVEGIRHSIAMKRTRVGAAEGGVGGATGGAAEDAMEGDAGGSAEGAATEGAGEGMEEDVTAGVTGAAAKGAGEGMEEDTTEGMEEDTTEKDAMVAAAAKAEKEAKDYGDSERRRLQPYFEKISGFLQRSTDINYYCVADYLHAVVQEPGGPQEMMTAHKDKKFKWTDYGALKFMYHSKTAEYGLALPGLYKFISVLCKAGIIPPEKKASVMFDTGNMIIHVYKSPNQVLTDKIMADRLLCVTEPAGPIINATTQPVGRTTTTPDTDGKSGVQTGDAKETREAEMLVMKMEADLDLYIAEKKVKKQTIELEFDSIKQNRKLEFDNAKLKFDDARETARMNKRKDVMAAYHMKISIYPEDKHAGLLQDLMQQMEAADKYVGVDSAEKYVEANDITDLQDPAFLEVKAAIQCNQKRVRDEAKVQADEAKKQRKEEKKEKQKEEEDEIKRLKDEKKEKKAKEKKEEDDAKRLKEERREKKVRDKKEEDEIKRLRQEKKDKEKAEAADAKRLKDENKPPPRVRRKKNT